MSKLRLHDSLLHSETTLTSPHDGSYKLYSCGPTVYNKVHIGNLRAYLLPDLIRRALEMNGSTVRWVMNLTDIDDKTIRDTIKEFGSNATPAELRTFTDRHTQAFFEELDLMNIPRNVITFVNVTDKIPEIQEFILQLIDNGFGYKADDGSTYFNIEKYQNEVGNYGTLIGEKFLEGKKIGARVKVDDYDKENLADFALWKAWDENDAQIYWDHPILGKGRPGWHIECTVINHDQFPEGTDIHTGGIDLLFPHHTNEIAQALPIYQPFVKHWVHNEHITVSDEKMSKRLGNILYLDNLIAEQIADGLDLRYLYLQSHYKTRSNVTHENLGAAKTGLRRLREAVGQLEKLVESSGKAEAHNDAEYSQLISNFQEAINNDLNTPSALAVLSEVLTSSTLPPTQKLQAIYQMDAILGLNLKETHILPQEFEDDNMIDPEVTRLLGARLDAKNQKDYAEADRLRDEIEALGYEVIDTSEGSKLRKISP